MTLYENLFHFKATLNTQMYLIIVEIYDIGSKHTSNAAHIRKLLQCKQ